MPRKPSKKNAAPVREPEFAGAEALRVLVVSPARRDSVADRLGGDLSGWVVCDNAPELSGVSPLVVIDDASVGGADRLVKRLATKHGARVVVLCETIAAERVVKLQRSGAVDILLPTDDPKTTRTRLERAAADAGDKDEALRRAALVRDDLVNQLGTLCNELGSACKSLAGNMQNVALASEMTAILRQELDLESLLRTVLELMLKRTGPTNAAVFLPSTAGDYSLGAYANYDCPRDSAETMLDELAGVFGPRFENITAPVLMSGEDELGRRLGHAAHWLEDSTVLVAACRDAAECRAVLVLFRDRRAVFNEATTKTVNLMCGLVGEQLARVVRTHNRHLPKDKWASPGDHTGGNDADLAA
jgi:hypothetical protein